MASVPSCVPHEWIQYLPANVTSSLLLCEDVTTTTTVNQSENRGLREKGLEFPAALSDRQRALAEPMLEGLSTRLAQQLLDELMARMESGEIRRY